MAEGAEDTLRVACPVLGNSPARANFHALPSSLEVASSMALPTCLTPGLP